MKHNSSLIVVFLLASTIFLSNCDSPAAKVENAQERVEVAEDDLANAQEEYRVDVEYYKKDMLQKIENNNQDIEKLRRKINVENEKKDVKDEYRKKINDLEQRNYNLRKKIDAYQARDKEEWENFKREFNQDIDSLGESLKNFDFERNK